jgi:peptidoglycan hydrolase-like protein with peptidoglycan-binding domain
MYTEETTPNEAMALVADPNSQSNIAVAEASGLNKPTLRLGSTGPTVKELQQLLCHWKYHYCSPFDGIFGVVVEFAVKRYQHRVFLAEDGVVGTLTWEALFTGAPVNMPTLMTGSSGNAVKLVQNVLKLNNNCSGGVVDGIFGPSTKAAVQTFQTAQGLPADGIVEYTTWYALSKLPH